VARGRAEKHAGNRRRTCRGRTGNRRGLTRRP
jgi:hypothetical protein